MDTEAQEGSRPLTSDVVEALVSNDHPFLYLLERRAGSRSRAAAEGKPAAVKPD